MNILYIHSHDTGRYVQPYGHAIETPNIQRLAEEGVLFRQNFCICPTCSPSRAALLTGCYPHENGMIGLAHRGFALHNYKQHIIHTLRKYKYTSVLAGVQHIANWTGGYRIIGYDRCLTERCDDIHLKAAHFLKNSPQEPFFLSVGFAQTHRVFPKTHPYDDARYCMPPAPIPDTPRTREDMACFKASVRKLDKQIGFVLNALKNGLDKRTLVICTTDHGIAFPRMKCNLYDSGIGTMLIIRGPGGFSGGKVIDGMTTHMDIFPTICDLLDIRKPMWLRGRSLMPLINVSCSEIHRELFFEINYHAAYEPVRAVRTNRWKYIRRFDRRRKPVLPNCDDSDSKLLWLKSGWRNLLLDKEELYNLIFDPNEANNLARKAGYKSVLCEMRGKLMRWMKQTEDPLLEGFIRAPKGAEVNDVNGISPLEKTFII